MKKGYRRQKYKAAGFTLLELMIVVAIMGIMAAIAAPSYRLMMANSKVRELGEQWQTSYYRAQRDALLRKDIIVMCAVDSFGKGSEQCDTKNPLDFSNGWKIFSKSDPDNPIEIVTPVNKINAKFNGNPLNFSDDEKVALYFLRDGRLPMGFVGKSLILSYPTDNPIAEKRYCINSAGRIKIVNKECNEKK